MTKPRIRKVSASAVAMDQRIQALYEGASTGSRMGMKGMQSSGPNAELERDQVKLVKRSRHALKNNAYAGIARNAYVDNLVGNGIQAKWPTQELQKLWDRWCLQCDADGIDNFHGLQALLCGAEFSDGEILVRRRWRRPGDGLVVPFQIELLECDHLPIELNDFTKLIRCGIQKNVIGQRTHYHIWREHPLDMQSGNYNETRAVAADDVIHYFQRLRPKQDRGIPHLSIILLRLYELDEMQDATLVKQKLAQLFAWIIKKRSDFDGGDPDGSGNDFGEHVGEESDGTSITKIKPGTINYLDDDEDISFSTPDGIGDNYAEWLKTELRAAAKAVGLTYEQFTGDLTEVNYSSIRAGLIEFRRRIERLQHHLMIFRFCHRVAIWFLDAVWLNRILPLNGYAQDPFQFLPTWKPPRWDWVDPLKDAMADILEVRAGMNTLKGKLAERGLDFDDTVAQLMIEQGVSKPEDLVLDTNPRAVNKSGALQQGHEVLASTSQV